MPSGWELTLICRSRTAISDNAPWSRLSSLGFFGLTSTQTKKRSLLDPVSMTQSPRTILECQRSFRNRLGSPGLTIPLFKDLDLRPEIPRDLASGAGVRSEARKDQKLASTSPAFGRHARWQYFGENRRRRRPAG